MRDHLLLIEPYLTGSHRAWAEGYAQASRLSVKLAAMPGRFWKWRMHGAAVTMARRLRASSVRPDVVLATDMLDVAAFRGLCGESLAGVPVFLYMHENQLAYPALPDDPTWPPSRRRRAAGRDVHYSFVNLTSALAADRVLWNSHHNLESFLESLPGFLRSFPDNQEMNAVRMIADRSEVLPLGLELRSLDAAREAREPRKTPRVLWNHRWEHDKDPETFFRAIDALAQEHQEFELVVLGESFVRAPAAFAAARERLGDRIVQLGHVADRAEYARWLWSSDIVVSTARHEFFGAAMAEAIYCGCRPVLPNRLSYPELIPPEHHAAVLYDGFDGLMAGLRRALGSRDEMLVAALRDAVAQFDWSAMAPRYDAILAGGRQTRA